MVVAVIQLLAIVFVALCLVPAGAHLFELGNKIVLSPDQYMTVQRIYRGWALFGIAVFGALGFTLAAAGMLRDQPTARNLALIAFLCIVVTQFVFWTYTYPMNALTENWTVMPQPFEPARRQWEYSHAVNAIVTLVALLAITMSALATRGRA